MTRQGRTGSRRLRAAGFACPITRFVEHTLDPVESGAGQQDAVGERRQPLTGDPQRVGVAIKSDQPQAGQLGEEPLGMPARTQRGVDQHGTRAVGASPGQRGLQQFDAAIEQNRDVAVFARGL